ncbi:hypothetical protein CAter282_0366 [Collimonas arenae]|uniref:DUF2827 domain-containing protein n=1 Tax=Collimonas arenae TaxID=279058 RepID=A0A127QDS9_9BURK|nr:DUF2827 domain-containing protein [Collimonas arenae]AMO98309.1 hypothetical protein CAter10_0387 [Collimonas arenae]AMP08184.1 hypothetical protein CAter282_0366 [Collimonas arenae]
MKPLSRTLRIGITIGLRQENESMWTNGIKQNALYLAESLKQCPSVASVHLVNTTAVAITPALPWDQARWPTATFEHAKDNLDVLIELGGQVNANQTAYLKEHGCRLISYCCGVEYVNVMQSMLFDRPMWGYDLFVNQRYDAIWMVPQVANSSQSYFETLRRRPAQVVPFVWDPIFVNQRSQDFEHHGEYRPQPGPKRLTVMEPNQDIVKFCMYPVFIAEEAYRQRPQDIALLQVTNADRLAHESKEFVAVMNQLDIVRQHKAVFVGRHDTPQFLSEMTDVVISHQIENALNYFYFDVCWQGYPLVHNAYMCRDLGYFYEGNDVREGSRKLIEVLTTHDDNWQDYIARQRQVLGRYLPACPEVTAEYERLLTTLLQQPLV